MSISIFSARKGRVAVAVAALAISAVALSGCASDDSTPAASGSAGAAADYGTLKLQLSWIKNEEFAGEYYADSKGYFKDAGFSSVEMTAGPSTGTAELLSGSADIALSDAVATGSVVASEQAPLKIIGTTYQKNPFTILSIAGKGDIKTPEDMIGKKIGVQASNTSLFEALLAANGLTDKQVTIVPVEYDPSVLVNGDVDGFVAYLTNEAIIVKAQGLDTVNLPFADNGLPFVAETIITTDDTIANKPDMLKAFLVAEIKGWTDAVNDPDGGADLALETYGKDLGLDKKNSYAGSEAASTELVVSPDTEANGLFTISDELQAETVASLKGAGIDVTADQLFDMSLLTEVYKENPDLIKYAK